MAQWGYAAVFCPLRDIVYRHAMYPCGLTMDGCLAPGAFTRAGFPMTGLCLSDSVLLVKDGTLLAHSKAHLLS